MQERNEETEEEEGSVEDRGSDLAPQNVPLSDVGDDGDEKGDPNQDRDQDGAVEAQRSPPPPAQHDHNDFETRSSPTDSSSPSLEQTEAGSAGQPRARALHWDDSDVVLATYAVPPESSESEEEEEEAEYEVDSDELTDSDSDDDDDDDEDGPPGYHDSVLQSKRDDFRVEYSYQPHGEEMKSLLETIYSLFCPSKTAQVPRFLELFEHRERALLVKLGEKYSFPVVLPEVNRAERSRTCRTHTKASAVCFCISTVFTTLANWQR